MNSYDAVDVLPNANMHSYRLQFFFIYIKKTKCVLSKFDFNYNEIENYSPLPRPQVRPCQMHRNQETEYKNSM